MKTKHYQYLLIFILLIAVFLRFYDFPTRWIIYADQARDAIVASKSLKHHSLPLVGSFSSAGPFLFGPLFYWFIIGCYFFAPKILIFPWIVITVVDILLVFIMVKIGKTIAGEKMGLLLGLFSAISTNQILRASNLTQHTFVSISTGLTILFFLLSLKKKRIIYLFLLGISIGLGISMHYQSINLLLYGLAIFIFDKIKFKKFLGAITAFLSGLLIPSAPMLYWDGVYEHWANINNLIEYLLVGQYKIWVSNRWLTYLSEFWPSFWAKVIGGEFILGAFLMTVIGISGAYLFFKGKLKKDIFWLGLIFFIQLFLNRYYRGEKFEGYLLYFHSLILIFSAWVVLQVAKANKLAGVLFLLIIIFFSLKKDISSIRLQDNKINKVWQTIAYLKKTYPERKFAIYDLWAFDPSFSQMLSLFLYFENLSGEKDVFIGVTQGALSYKERKPIYEVKLVKEFQLYELDKDLVKNEEWLNVNPDYLYEDVLWWWKGRSLVSTFSLKKYLVGKINFR